jgi:predicted O-methyltransferase YrrM
MHLRPAKVIETGVARGITSRIVLEALTRNEVGHLWSIDLPAMDPTLHAEIAVAVPESLRGRWTYITGTSRRRLPKLLENIGPIDLFLHDSSHTERNVRFELEHAWAALRAGGALVADDVQQSSAFDSFSGAMTNGRSFVCQADDGRALFGVAVKLA